MIASGTLSEGERKRGAPAQLPLLPKAGKDFLDGSIDPEHYLAAKRAEAVEQALCELDEAGRRSRTLRIEMLSINILLATNLVMAVLSFVAGDTPTAIMALAVVILTLPFLGWLYIRPRRLRHE